MTSLRGGFFEARISFNGFELKITKKVLLFDQTGKPKRRKICWLTFFFYFLKFFAFDCTCVEKNFNLLEEEQYCVIKDFLASFTFPLSLRFLWVFFICFINLEKVMHSLAHSDKITNQIPHMGDIKFLKQSGFFFHVGCGGKYFFSYSWWGKLFSWWRSWLKKKKSCGPCYPGGRCMKILISLESQLFQASTLVGGGSVINRAYPV